jgi:hypothetical protein
MSQVVSDWDRTIISVLVYSTRPGISADSNIIQVFFNGVQLDSLALGGVRAAGYILVLAEALALRGTRPMRWGQIYDLIEFIGSENLIVEADIAPRTEIRRLRTTNHFRHLGNPAQYPLPANPATLAEAIISVTHMVK